MKNYLALIMALITIWINAQTSGGGEANPDLRTHQEALNNFQDHRFGMFIHWGPVTLRGTEIGWSRGVQVPIEDYDSLYKEFNPVLFDAQKWVKTAKEAGMKYMVITSRHHDGFSLWDSQYTDYDMTNTPYGKGVLKDLADECKKQGIDFGIYYSICDWHHQDYPVEYPHKDYKYHVEKEITDATEKDQMNRYIAFIKNQLKELIDLYDPSLIWFDGEWEWAWTHEMGMDLYAYLRGLKNDLLINNRVDKGREGMAGITKSFKYAGDFATPEQEIGKYDISNAWESCITIARQWAWKANDQLKSEKECIQTLVQTVGGGGNLLLNVGPMADGRIEQRQKDRLKAVGDWLKVYGDAVYGTRGGPFMPNNDFVSTRKDQRVFLHLLNDPGQEINLPVAKSYKVKSVYYMGQEVELDWEKKKGLLTISLDGDLPDENVSVIVIEMNKGTEGLESVKI